MTTTKLFLATTDGQLDLRELVQQNHLQHADALDAIFIRKFVDTFMQKDESALWALQQLVQQEYSPQSDDEKANESAAGDLLLCFYIALLHAILVRSSSPAILDRPSVRQFLCQFQCRLFAHSSAQHASLSVLSYELLFEFQKMRLPQKQWPLQIDLPSHIFAPLEAESTPIGLRQTIERVAIGQMGEAAGAGELVGPLAEVLLAADFLLVIESCARILSTCQNLADVLPKEAQTRIVQKAKRTKRIGHAFAGLTAKLLICSSHLEGTTIFEAVISEGFLDRSTHSLVLAKLAASMDNGEIMKREVLDLLAVVSNFDLNLVGPLLLPHYRQVLSQKEFASFLCHLFDNGKWQNCSCEALNAFAQSLLATDPQLEGIVPEVVKKLLPHLLTTPSALSILEGIYQGAPSFFQKHSELARQIGDRLAPILLIDDTSEEDATTAWESMDSALRLLAICGTAHGLDEDALFHRLLAIALQGDQFLRQSAVQLVHKFHWPAAKLTQKWADLFLANDDHWEIRHFLLCRAMAGVEQQSQGGGGGIIREHAIALLDMVEPDEEESPEVLRKAAQFCEAIIVTGGDDSGKENVQQRFSLKLAQLLGQLEMMERREKERMGGKGEESQMDEMIAALGQNCTIGGDQCGSKDCY